MKKTIIFRALFFTTLFSLPASLHAANESTGTVQVLCKDHSRLDRVDPYYVKHLSEALQKAGAGKVLCTECTRDFEEQAKKCLKLCGTRNGCSGICAKPGTSQHEKENVAVCDISKLKGDGCNILKKLCDEMYGGNCGIGGYGGGDFHFGVRDSFFSSWTECGHLTGNTKAAQKLLERFQAAKQDAADLSK